MNELDLISKCLICFTNCAASINGYHIWLFFPHESIYVFISFVMKMTIVRTRLYANILTQELF